MQPLNVFTIPKQQKNHDNSLLPCLVAGGPSRSVLLRLTSGISQASEALSVNKLITTLASKARLACCAVAMVAEDASLGFYSAKSTCAVKSGLRKIVSNSCQLCDPSLCGPKCEGEG